MTEGAAPLQVTCLSEVLQMNHRGRGNVLGGDLGFRRKLDWESYWVLVALLPAPRQIRKSALGVRTYFAGRKRAEGMGFKHPSLASHFGSGTEHPHSPLSPP